MPIQLRGGTGLIDPVALLTRAGIRQGYIVAEFGCGTSGHLVFPAAHLVGSQGKVYAIDILKSVLEAMESRRKLEGVDNVEAMWTDLERPGALKLTPGSVDLAVLLHILGQVKAKSTMLEEAFRIMKPGGVLLIADWNLTATPLGPPPERRFPVEEARRLAEGGQFEFVESFAVGKYHWGIICKKKS